MRTVVITGATSGIGFSIAQQFAEQFYCVIGVGRSREKCAAAVDKIKALVPGGKVIYFCGDLMHQRKCMQLQTKSPLIWSGNARVSSRF